MATALVTSGLIIAAVSPSTSLASVTTAKAAPAVALAAATKATYPAPGAVGAKGTLKNVYPPGGVLSIKTPTILSNVKIHGGIDIYANTTLRNVYVENNGTWWGNVVVRNNASLLAVDCTIKPTNTSPNDARRQDGVLDVAAKSITISRCDISGTSKGALIGDNTVIEDSWLHGFTPYFDPTSKTWTHKEAVMTMGGSNIHIIRCRCVANNPAPYNATTNPTGFLDTSQTASILLQPWEPIRNVTIDSSLLGGGYYALRMQSMAANDDTGLVVTNNVFTTPTKGGGYTTIDRGVKITTWSHNVKISPTGVPSIWPVNQPTA